MAVFDIPTPCGHARYRVSKMTASSTTRGDGFIDGVYAEPRETL
jgi:hypothetical protein